MASGRRPITKADPRVIGGRLFTTERGYRDALAQRRGFPSFAAQRRGSLAAYSVQELNRLTPEQLAERGAGLDFLARIRRGEDIDLARGFARVSPERAQLHVGNALFQDQRGHWRATPYDRLPRVLAVLTPGGWEPVVVRDSRTASLLGRHAAAVRAYRDYGQLERFREFRGRSFQAAGRQYRFLDDRDESVLRRLVLSGQFDDLIELYQDGLVSDAGFT